jgi:beta-lactamase regulating signal transducer with metallopeptidase domain
MTLSLVSSQFLATLLDVTLKASVVLGAALLATRLLRRRSAALRHLVLVLALAGICALPFVERLLPKLPTPGLAKILPAEQPAAPPTLVQVAPASSEATQVRIESQPTPPPAAAKHVHVHDYGTYTVTSTQSAESVPVTVEPKQTVSSDRWPLALLGLWAVGVLYFSLRVLVGIARLKHVVHHAEPVVDPQWDALLRGVCSRLGIRRPVTLLRSADIDVPLTTGTVYPLVVVPVEAGEWTPARCMTVLHHELAHVKRLDALTQWLAQAALALHWFNPLAWMAVRQMRLEREKACDDFVLAAGARASEYAHDLLEIVTQLTGKRECAVALAMARKSNFEGRLLALLDPRRNRHALSRAAVGIGVAVALALVLPLAAMSPQEEPPTPPTPPAPTAGVTAPALPAAPTSALAPTTPAPSDPQPAIADAPEAPEALATEAAQAPTPEPRTAPEARAAEAASPTPQAAPAAPVRAGSGQGYGYGYAIATSTAQAGVPAVPATPAAPSARMNESFPGPDCKDKSGTTSVSMSHNTDDSGHETMSGSWTRGSCTIRINAAGKLAFSADATQLLSITPDDGFVDVTELIGGDTRRVKVTTSGGTLKYEYWRNAQSQPFDADARAWFSRFLVSFERHTGYSAATRVPLLLKQGGPNAVLNEVTQMDSDYVASLYLRKMLEATQLDAPTLRRTIEQAGRQLSSDYEKSQVLMTIAQKYPLADDASRAAFLGGADSLKSDYEHARVLIEFLKRPNLSKEQVRASLASAAKLGSDYERARVLMTMLDQRMIDASMQEIFFNAANGITSDYEHSRTLIGLLDAVPLNQQIVTRLIQATSTIQSDYERSRVLATTAGKYAVTGQARAAYLQAANGIKSEYERNRALAALSNSTRM